MSDVNLLFNSPWFGNQLFIYAFAKSYCIQHGFTLHTHQPWTGQRVFDLNEPPITQNYEIVSDGEYSSWRGRSNISIIGYAQRQDCINYTRSSIKDILRLRPQVADILSQVPTYDVCAHIREGDYLFTAGFVPISRPSYERAAVKFGVSPSSIHYVSIETPYVHEELISQQMDFVADFYQLMKARILFRGNSTFSFWAAVLGDAERVFAPRIDGIAAHGDGDLKDVEFEEGNHPKCADWPFITDVFLYDDHR